MECWDWEAEKDNDEYIIYCNLLCFDIFFVTLAGYTLQMGKVLPDMAEKSRDRI